MLIGLCGLIGSGKTTVLKYLAENYRLQVLNLDLISRDLISSLEVKNFLKQTFPKVVGENEQVDRGKLRSVLFQDLALNKQFAQFFWPRLAARLQLLLKEFAPDEDLVVEGAILPVLNVEFTKKILITADDEKMLTRIINRDMRSESETRKIIAIQKYWFHSNQIRFDDVICNNTSFADLYSLTDQKMRKYGVAKIDSN